MKNIINLLIIVIKPKLNNVSVSIYTSQSLKKTWNTKCQSYKHHLSNTQLVNGINRQLTNKISKIRILIIIN